MTWTITPYDLPLAVPYRWSHGVQNRRQGLIVRYDASTTGWGEVAPPPDDVPDTLLAEADASSKKWQAASPRIRCGHATAYFDAQARAEELTLAQWLHENHDAARPRKEVQVNALLTGGAEIVAEANAAWAQGHRTFKIKVGGQSDVARVAAVRQAFPKAVIRLDANAAWDLRTATARLTALAPYRVAYIEQPLPPEDEAGLRALTRRELIPIALDESATDSATVARLLDNGIGDAIILKQQRLGGPDRAVQLIHTCADRGVPVTVTNSLETSVGLHAALHIAALAPDVACGLGTARYFAKDVAAPPEIKDGRMRVVGPGTGVSL